MASRSKAPLHARIDEKLRNVAESFSTTPGWYEQWRQLGPESTTEERLKVHQAIRDADGVAEEAGFFLVSWQIDEIASANPSAAMCSLEDRLEAVKRRHGLGEGDRWPPGEAPPEYESLRQQYHRVWDGHFADKLDEYGEHEMARLMRDDPDRFEQLIEAGRHFFLGAPTPGISKCPGWLDSFVEIVVAHMSADAESGPLGLRYREEDGFWEITIYPTPVELVGGAHDGEVVAPGFSLDLEGLRSLFERIDDVGWSALGSPSEPPNVWIEGLYLGNEILLRVLAHAPEDEEPGMKYKV